MTPSQPPTNDISKLPTRALILGSVGIVLLLCALVSVLFVAKIPFLIFATGPLLTLPLVIIAGFVSGFGVYYSLKTLRSTLSTKTKAWVGMLINSTILLVSLLSAVPILLFTAGFAFLDNATPLLGSLLGSYTSVDFSPSGDIVAAGRTNKVEIIDVKTGKTLRTLNGINNQVEKVQFSPNGNYVVASYDFSQKAMVWDTASFEEVSKIDLGANDWIEGFYFSSDGNSLILIERVAGAVQIDLTTFEKRTLLDFGKEFLPRNYFYISTSYEYLGMPNHDFSELPIWKTAEYIDDPNSAPRLNLPLRPNADVRFFGFSPNEKILAIPTITGADHTELNIFDIPSAQYVDTIALNPPTNSDTRLNYRALYDFSPDSKTLTYIDPQNHVISVDLITFESKTLNTTLQEGLQLGGLKYSPDGTKILLINNTSLQLWDAQSGAVLWGNK